MQKRALPLGSSNFVSLRQASEIYVDKTDLIYKLTQNKGFYFLIRPRRFGKSLLISTIETLFVSGIKEFSGLSIAQKWSDNKTYRVAKLDFSEIMEFSDIEDFKLQLSDYVASKFQTAGFKRITNDENTYSQLCKWLSTLKADSLVVLIDEYDAPLTKCLDNPKLFKEVSNILNNLYLTLKCNENCLRFLFITGITHFGHSIISQVFDNLEDISLNPVYATLLGFSENEILAYFEDYLFHAAQSLNTSENRIVELLRGNYSGYSFKLQGNAHVYNPWSVLNFFNYPELGFCNYWFTSGGNPFTLINSSKNQRDIQKKPIPVTDFLNGLHKSDFYTDILLYQTGYLTIRGLTQNRRVQLDFPNLEIAESFAELAKNN